MASATTQDPWLLVCAGWFIWVLGMCFGGPSSFAQGASLSLGAGVASLGYVLPKKQAAAKGAVTTKTLTKAGAATKKTETSSESSSSSAIKTTSSSSAISTNKTTHGSRSSASPVKVAYASAREMPVKASDATTPIRSERASGQQPEWAAAAPALAATLRDATRVLSDLDGTSVTSPVLAAALRDAAVILDHTADTFEPGGAAAAAAHEAPHVHPRDLISTISSPWRSPHNPNDFTNPAADASKAPTRIIQNMVGENDNDRTYNESSKLKMSDRTTMNQTRASNAAAREAGFPDPAIDEILSRLDRLRASNAASGVNPDNREMFARLNRLEARVGSRSPSRLSPSPGRGRSPPIGIVAPVDAAQVKWSGDVESVVRPYSRERSAAVEKKSEADKETPGAEAFRKARELFEDTDAANDRKNSSNEQEKKWLEYHQKEKKWLEYQQKEKRWLEYQEQHTELPKQQQQKGERSYARGVASPTRSYSPVLDEIDTRLEMLEKTRGSSPPRWRSPVRQF